jgi:hypothetical protein
MLIGGRRRSSSARRGYWQRLNVAPSTVGGFPARQLDPLGQTPSEVQSRLHFPPEQ